MTKQEEIREGVALKLAMVDGIYIETNKTARDLGYPTEWAKYYERADQILTFLHSQGVVIKVERELPVNQHGTLDKNLNMGKAIGYSYAQKDMLEAGYVAVIPLSEG